MAIITSRRSLIAGFAALVAAPAIVRASNIMPVRALPAPPVGAQAFYNAMRNAELELRMFGVCYVEQQGDTLSHIPIEDVFSALWRSSAADPSPS